MNFTSLVQNRQSCRAYLEQPIEREKLLACLEAGRLAPSACNSQPWTFIAVDDPQVTTAVAPLLQDRLIPINRFARQVPAYIVIVEEPAVLSAKLGGHLKSQTYAQIDIGLAAGQICLAATDLDLGHCIIGWFSEKKLKKLLNIPEKKRIRLVIALGYPEQSSIRAKKRKEFDEVVHFNQYDQSPNNNSALVRVTD